MSAQVKLSLRAARNVYDFCDPNSPSARELEAAIARATRASATRKRLGAPKRAKKASKREETQAIRAAVMERARGRCEACGVPSVVLELDHQHGRGKAPQSVENCRALCPLCHREKTLSRPSAAHWLKDFAAHCDVYGYAAEAKRARARLSFVEARGGK